MESAGKYLKQEREIRNLSLKEVAKSTKIREHFLRAIEEDRYDLLPPTVYVKGYLTLYARYLGIDPKNVILQYQNYLKTLIVSKLPALQQQIISPKKRFRPWVFLIIILAITLFIAFFVYIISNKPSKEKTIIPPLLSIQEKVGIQSSDQARQKEILNQKEEEAKNIIPTKIHPLEVLEASMGTGIERESGRLILTGKCSEFPCNNQRAYFFTRVKTRREGKIAHIWLWEGKEFHRVEIEVKPPAWSVYSYLTIRPHLAGNWKAEARYGDHVLITIRFKATGFPDYSVKEKE